MKKGLSKFFIFLVIGGSTILAIPTQAMAIPISGFMSGTINSVDMNIYDPDAYFPDDIVAGMTFEGTFSYNTDLFYIDENYTGIPQRRFFAEDLSVTINLIGATNKYTFTGGCDDGIYNHYYVTDSTYDSFSFDAWCGIYGSAGDFHAESMQFETTDSTGTVFNDSSLPTALSLDDFDINSFRMGFQGWGGGGSLKGEIETLYAQPVPEPSAILLMGAGLLCLVGYRRRCFNIKM